MEKIDLFFIYNPMNSIEYPNLKRLSIQLERGEMKSISRLKFPKLDFVFVYFKENIFEEYNSDDQITSNYLKMFKKFISKIVFMSNFIY